MATKKRRKRTSKEIPAKGRLRDMADRLWSIAVKGDWANRCAVCGSTSKLNAHHLIGRTHQATRYNLRNGMCLCPNHHQWDKQDTKYPFSAHGDARAFNKWLDRKHPALAAWVDETKENGEHRNFNGTTNAAYYIDIIQGLREYVEPEEFATIVGVHFGEYLETLTGENQ